MMTREDYRQLQAFARVDGVWVAVLWTVSFACFVWQFQMPLFSFVSLLIGAGSLIFASLRTRRFRDSVRSGHITFGQAFFYGMLIYLYASLLFAFAQFIYFRFMDGGYMMSRYTAIMQTDEFAQMMRFNGLKENDMQIAMDNLAALRPIEIAMQFFTLDIIMGLCISLPIALIIKKK